MDNELNRFLHETILGETRKHSWRQASYTEGDVKCAWCNLPLSTDNGETLCPNPPIPNYTASRDLVAAVEAKVVDKVGRDNYIGALTDLTDYPITADALTRSKACRAAWESRHGA